MVRRGLISVDQEEEVVRLYRSQAHAIKEIMALTGVRSEQTIYRILDSRDIPRQKVRKPVRKVTIGLDAETDEIISKVSPKNLSQWICDMVKRGHKK